MDYDSMTNRKRKTLSQVYLPNNPELSSKRKRANEEASLANCAGTIVQIILKNFMCYSMLVVDLSTNINMVIGSNGSGKSAILTALILGLGGKAGLTNRGTSIKSFIKAGKNSGSVEICLHNEGIMAYRPKVYGAKITVIRNFTASGSCSYKIKAEAGQIASTQLRELRRITTSLNIQVDNPICILNQDVSRNFLSSNDPKHKFALFMKATRLEELADQYKTAVLNRNEATRILKEKQTMFKELKDELQNLDRKIDNHRSIITLRDMIKLIQIELLWAQIRDAEEDVEAEQSKVDNLQYKYAKMKDENASRSDRIKTIKANTKRLNKEIDELKQTIQVQSRPQFDVKRIIDDLRNKLNAKRQEKQLANSMIATKTKDADALQNEIENATKNITRAEQDKIQRLRDLNEMNEKIKGVEDHLQTCQNDLYQFKSEIARREDDQQRIRREIMQLDQRINDERGILNALKTESGNSLHPYGRDIPLVKLLIEQNKAKFTHVPRGPLGSYIKLKNKMWSIAVESFLTPNLLSAFTVDNRNDNALLVNIFSQALDGGRKPTIITSRFFYQKHDVCSNLVRAPSECVCMYDALEIDDAVVANCIVDQAGVESVLLIPSNERAIELMSNSVNVPTNCRQGVTTGGDKSYPDPNYKTYGSRYRRAQYLQVDTAEHIIQLEQNLKELAQKKASVEAEYDAVRRDIREQDAKKDQLEEKIRKMKITKVQIRRQLEEWNATAEPEVASVELLENELTEIRRVVQEKTAQLAILDEAIREIKQSIIENDDRLQTLKNSNSSLEERMRVLEAQIQEDAIRQKEIATSDEFDKRKLGEIQTKLKEAMDKLVAKQLSAQTLCKRTSNLGDRQNTNRKVQDIINEITELERSVNRIESDVENITQLKEKYKQLSDKPDKLTTILGCINEDIEELSTAVERRRVHYKLTEGYFIRFIKLSFKTIMKMRRQFEGSIEIDMAEKKLELIVIPQQGSQGLTATSNLSGGERSFSTVTFLYALWQCMEFPFCFLDEFDVYMDKLNRTKAIDILLHHAETHPELQFVFLTPQDVSFIMKNVSILRLSEPERN